MQWTIQFALAACHLHFIFVYWLSTRLQSIGILYIPPLSTAWVCSSEQSRVMQVTGVWNRASHGKTMKLVETFTCNVSSAERALTALIVLGLLLFVWLTCGSVLCTRLVAPCAGTCSPWSARMEAASFFCVDICFVLVFPFSPHLFEWPVSCLLEELFLPEMISASNTVPMKIRSRYGKNNPGHQEEFAAGRADVVWCAVRSVMSTSRIFGWWLSCDTDSGLNNFVKRCTETQTAQTLEAEVLEEHDHIPLGPRLDLRLSAGPWPS